MTRAFVLSGGASLGAIQVGMARALDEAGVAPEMIVGTSVGAINGSWLASGRPIEGLANVWRGMRRSDLFPLRPMVGLRGFLGRRNNFVPNGGLRALLERNIDFARLEDAPIPLTVIASDALSGAEVALTAGPAVPALMASAAIPGVFVPIEIDGRALIDGGVAELIDRALFGTRQWLSNGCPDAMPLGLHRHPHADAL